MPKSKRHPSRKDVMRNRLKKARELAEERTAKLEASVKYYKKQFENAKLKNKALSERIAKIEEEE